MIERNVRFGSIADMSLSHRCPLYPQKRTCRFISPRPNTTLADLFKQHVRADPFSAVRASLRRQSSDERDDSVTDSRQAWLRRRSVDFFSPSRFFEATVLQEGEGEHRHERMAVKTLPGSPFEVVEAKFLFQLLMGLLANPRAFMVAAKVRRSVAAGRLAR